MADEDLGALAIRIAMEDSSFQQGMQDLKKQMGVVDSQFKSSIAGIKDWGGSLDGLKANASALGDKINVQKQIVQGYQSQLDKSKQSLQENASKMMDLKSKVDTARVAWEQSKATLGANAEATKKLKADHDSLNKEYIASQKAVMNNNKSVQGYTIQLNEATGKLKNMEHELKQVDVELKKASDETKKHGLNWKEMSTKASESVESTKSKLSGFKTALVGLSATLAGGFGLFKFTEGAITAGDNAYKLSQKLHLTATEASGLNRILSITGTDSAPLISTLTRLDRGLESAGEKGNATTKMLKEYGVSLKDANGKLLPMNAQLEQLAIAYKKASEAGQEEAFSAEVLGNKGAELIPLLENYTEAKNEAAKVKGIGIDPEQAHKTAEELKVLKMQVAATGGVMAKALIPVVQEVLPPLIQLFQKLTEQIKVHKAEIDKFIQSAIKIGKDLGSIVAPVIKELFSFIANNGNAVKNIVIGIGIAWGTLGAVKGIINGITGAMEMWQKATKAMEIAQKALNLVIKANTVGLIIAGVATLVAGIVLLFKNNKQFHDFVVNSWETIKKTVGGAVESVVKFFKDFGTATVNVFKEVKTGISDFITGMKNFFVNGWHSIINDVKNIISSFVNFVTDKFGWLINGVKNILNGFKTVCIGMWNAVKNIFLGAVLLIFDLVTGNFIKLKEDAVKIFNNLKEAFSQIWEGIKQVFSAAIGIIVEFFKMEWNGLVTIGKTIWNGFKDFMAGLWEGIKTITSNTWNGLKATVINLVNNIVQGAINIWTGLLNWFAELPGRLYNSAVSMFTSMKEGVVNTVYNVKNAIVEGISSAIRWITNLPSQAVTWGKDMIQGMIDGIKSMFGRIGDAVEGVADKIRSFLHFSVPDEGPLTDYETWMPDFMSGLAQGIEKNKNLVSNAIKNLATDVNVGMKLNPAIAGVGMTGTNESRSSNNLGNTIINFNGTYSFVDKNDIDYFMNKAAQLVQRRKK